MGSALRTHATTAEATAAGGARVPFLGTTSDTPAHGYGRVSINVRPRVRTLDDGALRGAGRPWLYFCSKATSRSGGTFYFLGFDPGVVGVGVVCSLLWRATRRLQRPTNSCSRSAEAGWTQTQSSARCLFASCVTTHNCPSDPHRSPPKGWQGSCGTAKSPPQKP